MSALCFGNFAKIIKKATSQTDEDVVYILLGSIIQPLSLKNKNGDEFIFDKKEISNYMNSKKNIPSTISSASYKVHATISSYFEANVLPKMVVEKIQVVEKIRSLVQNDVTILPVKKNALLALANAQNISDFLGEVFIYAVQADNTFNNEKLIPNIPNTTYATSLSNSETYLLAEVNMSCPICGTPFMKTKGSNAIPEYQITHIFPLNPSPEQNAILKTIIPPEYCLNDIKNKIALCQKCQNEYLSAFSIEEYNNLNYIKRNVSQIYQSTLSINRIEIESEITLIVKSLATIPQKDLGKKLSLKALKINNKIPTSNTALRIKVNAYVVTYFYFLRELFGEASRNSSFNYDLLAQEIKLACEKLLADNLSQDETFDKLTQWIRKQTKSKSTNACEIVIAYFIQNCEVFHEIAK